MYFLPVIQVLNFFSSNSEIERSVPATAAGLLESLQWTMYVRALYVGCSVNWTVGKQEQQRIRIMWDWRFILPWKLYIAALSFLHGYMCWTIILCFIFTLPLAADVGAAAVSNHLRFLHS